ncbi:VOC family protein [Helicobacter sp. MIT 05-5293]|uniref:VOC family protein n=1 Tax=Helicobacter sp. MIT 05-5293 TaxID=1548149 RepID=UPI0010FEA0FB|nr:VOC family protein [Helicobacter sp. MIT 05-5293]TLD80921.1 VOC family protein [Helicobacter sp. MIT 05-5293]
MIVAIDHIVLLTNNLEKCLAFYRDILECEVREQNGRYAICFGNQKINIHQHFGEFQPAASKPCDGALDFCLLAKGDIHAIKRKIESKGVKLEAGVVQRTGARAKLDSIYLKDPDGNLVEIAVEREEDAQTMR